MGKTCIRVAESFHLALQLSLSAMPAVFLLMMLRCDTGMSSVGDLLSVDATFSKELDCCVPLLHFVFLLCLLLLDKIKLLCGSFSEFQLPHSGHDGTKEVGCVSRRCRGGGCNGEAWKDVVVVEACAPFRKFVVFRGNGETSFGNLVLMHTEAPKLEMLDIPIDVCFVETFILIVVADMFALSGLAHKNERKGGRRVP